MKCIYMHKCPTNRAWLEPSENDFWIYKKFKAFSVVDDWATHTKSLTRSRAHAHCKQNKLDLCKQLQDESFTWLKPNMTTVGCRYHFHSWPWQISLWFVSVTNSHLFDTYKHQITTCFFLAVSSDWQILSLTIKTKKMLLLLL